MPSSQGQWRGVVRNMTEKALGALEAILVFLVSILPFLLTAAGNAWAGRRKVKFKRGRDPP